MDKSVYQKRVRLVAEKLRERGTEALILQDSEAHRDACVRYLTGHPSDATLIITKAGESVLVAWDKILASKLATASTIKSYADYENSSIKAIEQIIPTLAKKCVVELATYFWHVEFLRISEVLKGYDLRCEKKSAYQAIVDMRMVKDASEIENIRAAAKVTNHIIACLEEKVKSQQKISEMDVALLIERELRLGGCEKAGFATLAAGAKRSCNIHAFPEYTSGEWGGAGLSLVDFGVVFNGYTSDATMTVARGKLTSGQEELLQLVETAYKECLPLYKAGAPIKAAMDKAQKIFATRSRSMPHTLGHGIGLEIHENPRVSLLNESKFAAGMVVTLEPGLYDESLGGVRWENDILITENGNEELTCSKILRL